MRLTLDPLLFSIIILALLLLYFLSGNIYMASYASDNTEGLEGVHQTATKKNYNISGIIISVVW